MSLKDCFNNLKEPVEEKMALLQSDLDDAKSESDPWSGFMENTIGPLLEETLGGLLGDVANEWVQQLLERNTAGMADTLGSIYGAAAMTLTARQEMEIIGFAFLNENMKRDVQDRITVLREIERYVNILRMVIRTIIRDRTEPEIMRRVERALAAMRRMVIMLYRVQDGLDNHQYFNLGAFRAAETALNTAIEALNSDDPEIKALFENGVANARVDEYLKDAAKDIAKKKIVQVTTILFCVLEIAYRLPIPIARLSAVGASLSLATKPSPFDTLYHDRRTTPRPPDWDDMVGSRFIGGFQFDYQGLHILNNVITVDKNLIVAFRTNWAGIKLLAKHNLTQVNWMTEMAVHIRDDMDENLQKAKDERPTVLYGKVVEWNAELNAMKYSGWFEILTEGAASQNLSTDLRIIERIQNYLDDPTLNLEYSEDIITLFLAIVPSLASILFSKQALTRAHNGLAELNLLIRYSIAQDQALLNVLNLLKVKDNPLYQELYELYANFVNGLNKVGEFLTNFGITPPSTSEGIIRALNPANVMNLANELYQGIIGGGTLLQDVWNLGAECIRNNPDEPAQAGYSAIAFASPGPPYPTEQEVEVTRSTLENQGYKLREVIGAHNNVVEADNPFGPYTTPSWLTE